MEGGIVFQTNRQQRFGHRVGFQISNNSNGGLCRYSAGRTASTRSSLDAAAVSKYPRMFHVLLVEGSHVGEQDFWSQAAIGCLPLLRAHITSSHSLVLSCRCLISNSNPFCLRFQLLLFLNIAGCFRFTLTAVSDLWILSAIFSWCFLCETVCRRLWIGFFFSFSLRCARGAALGASLHVHKSSSINLCFVAQRLRSAPLLSNGLRF